MTTTTDNNNNPQKTIAFAVGASLLSTTAYTATLLTLSYYAPLIPPSSGPQNGTTTTTPTPSQPTDKYLYHLGVSTALLSISMIIALYFALRSYFPSSITPRQRLLAASSGALGALTVADVAAFPLTALYLSAHTQDSVGSQGIVIAPAFQLACLLLSCGALGLYNASLTSDPSDLNQPPTADDRAQQDIGTNNENNQAPAPVITTDLGSYGAMWANDNRRHPDNGSERSISMSTLDSAYDTASIPTAFRINL